MRETKQKKINFSRSSVGLYVVVVAFGQVDGSTDAMPVTIAAAGSIDRLGAGK